MTPQPGGWRARVARRILRLIGWRLVIAQPVPMKCVMVFYPHTSNWDFVIGIVAKWATGFAIRWIGKHTLFEGPFGSVFRRWGGIPVDRNRPAGFIDAIRTQFERHDEFRVVIAPEGTRRFVPHWKSGFYHLARALDAPVGLAFIDYPRRELGVGEWIALTGDRSVDMERIAAFYAGKRGCRPANQGPVRLA